jgi:hypothetical protein
MYQLDMQRSTPMFKFLYSACCQRQLDELRSAHGGPSNCKIEAPFSDRPRTALIDVGAI